MRMLSSWWTRLAASRWHRLALAAPLLLSLGCDGVSMPMGRPCTGQGCGSSGGTSSGGSTSGSGSGSGSGGSTSSSGSSGSTSSSSGGSSGTSGSSGSSGSDGSPAFRSPYAVAYSGDGALLAATDATAGELVIIDPAGTSPLRAAVKLAGRPKGLAWSGPGRVLVAEYGAGTVAEVDAAAGTVVRRLQVGSKATDVAVSADGSRVVVPDLGLGQVLILDGATGKAQPPVAVAPYPFAVALAPGGSTAVVTHLVASGDATRPDAAASITLLDVASGKVGASIRLPFGSSAVRGVRCSPDGKWAYAVHTVGRTTVPTTQLSRGWISTNALSVIDLAGQRLYATVLLDRLNEGAADLWGVDVSRDGASLWVSASGVHQVLRVDLALLHKLLAGQIPSELVRTPGRTPTLQDRSKAAYNRPLSDGWFEVAADPSKRSLLVDDLGALYGAGALQVFRLEPAQGPRGIALSPDGKQLAVALYFAGQVGLVKTATGSVDRFVDIGTQPPETWVRQGERVFHDASSTLQGWVSCATCHVDGRSDGLNWDLVNDGLGNPKNTKSVVYMPNTPPAMAHGIFATPGEAITGEFQYVKAFVPEPDQLYALGAYFNALAAEPDPFRQAGALSAAGQRGQAVFDRAGCGQCHAGKYRTDMKTHDVGTRNDRDSRADFDTPSLAELWRSAPYLHDGSAATLKDVLTTRNAGDKHAKTSSLSAQDLGDLVQYLLELDAPAPDQVEVFASRGASPPAAAFRGEPRRASTAGGLDLTDPRLAILDKILFIKRDFLPTDDNGRGGHMCDQYFGFNAVPGGGLFVLEGVLSGNPRERNVLANSTCTNGPHQGRKLEGGGFLSPELHPDGNQILFAYTDIGRAGTWDESSAFHIFKVNADGTGLTQLTQGPHSDFDPTWLPDGRIAFISDRRGGFGRCHPRPVPVYTLYVMNADGSNVEPLSYHETNEWQPSLDRNGLLLYTRWDYVDRGSNQVHNAWITNPDGLDARAVVGNYSTRGNVTPRMLMNIRAIPGTNKFVGTAAAHHQQAYGSLVIVDPDVEDDDGMAQYTRLTTDAGFPEATVDKNQDLKYATAWPIDEDRFLVVHDPSSNEAGLNNKRFAIYLIDRQGNKKLLFRDPNHSCLDPIPLAPRKLPPPLVSSRTAKKTDLTEMVLLNVYDSLLPYPTGVEIKALRVVQVFPKSTPYTTNPRKGHGSITYNDQNGRGSLGTVPVEKDGSARFLLPPGKAVYFQALDADGAVVQSMRSATYAVPGTSQVVCQGCHERRYRAPRPPPQMALALKRAPSTLQPEADGSWPLSFPRLIQPILDSRCKSCHQGGQTFSLAQGNYQGNGDRFYESYSNLRPYLYNYSSPQDWGPVRTTPGDFGARKSRLYPLLKGGHHGVTLSDAELRSFALWLDLNSDMYSDDAKRDAQGRGEAVTPSVE